MAGCCEHGNEPVGSIKCRKFFTSRGFKKKKKKGPFMELHSFNGIFKFYQVSIYIYILTSRSHLTS
jgi:hypothetical protein